MILSLLLAATSSWALFLSYKVRSLKKENERLRREGKEDSKVLFLNSRYASMGETVGNIAHQWKQPLNAIGTIQNSIKATLIFQGEISKEKLLYSVETSFKLLQHLAETIDTFYSFLSQQTSEKMSFSVADELEKVRKITEYSFENSHITLNYELEINPTIQGNANEFTHAMLNLILNAKDAFDTSSIEHPTITVRVIGEENNSIITVSDNAGGIRLNPVEMVFDLHMTTKEEGSGLGLFMTKNIIEKRFGGTIGVKNKNDGACFTITLPYSEYGERYADTVAPDERLTLERINQLSRKVIELEEVEKALKKWADIFQKAHWGIAIHVGTSNHFESTNEAFNALYGYTPEELREISVPDLFPPETLSVLSDVQQRAFENGYVAFETINKRRDGSTFPVSVELIVAKDNEGEILYHMANVWDMSEKKAAEKELLLVSKALNNTSEAVYIMIKEHFIQVNDGACKMLGYSREEFASMNLYDIDNEASPEIIETITAMSIEHTNSFCFQRKHCTKEGHVLDVEIIANFFEHDGVIYTISTVRDITEQKQEHEELLLKKFALNTINEAVFLIDKDSRFHYVNEGACESLGYTREEFLTMGVTDLDPNFPIEQWRLHWEDIKAQKSTLTQTQHQRKDGTLFPIEISSNYFEYNGLGYSLAVSRDITERLLLEKEKENRRFKSIAENIPDNIARWDTEGRYLYINPTHERTLGVTAADIIGKTTKEVFPDEQFAVGAHSVDQVLATGKALFVQHPIVQEDGDMGWHDVNYVPERDETGKIISVLGVGRDMTHIYRLQNELEKHRSSLSEAQKLAKIGSWDFDLKTNHLSWSDEYFQILELDPTNDPDAVASFETFFEKVHPEDREFVTERFNAWQTSMEPYNTEHRLLMSDGRVKFIHQLGGIRCDQNGTPSYAMGTIHDITERKMMESALQEANERYIQILDNSIDVIYLIEVTLDGHFVYVDVNAAYEEVTGIPRDVVIGLDVEDIEDKTFRTILIDKFTSCLNAGEKTDYTADYPFPAGIRTFHSILLPIRDDSGRIIRIVGSARDITERKELEALLEKERKFLIDAQQVAHTGSWHLDIQNRLLTWSDETYRIFELDKENIVDLHKTFYERVHPEEREMVEAPYVESLKTKLPYEMEHRIVMSDGRIKYVIERCEHFYDDNGTPLYSIGTVQDITERREKEETIKELNATLEKKVIERTAQLQKSQETFRAIVENSPDVISRYDLQMRRTYINPLMHYLLDKPLDEVLGKTPREFSPLPDVDVFEHLFNTVVQGKSELEYEGAFIAPWGEKRWGNQRIIPEFDEDRNVISVMVIGRDMTERVEAEKRLKMIEMAVNSSAEAVYINNKELSIIYVNDEACRMLGYSRNELLSMKILEIDAKYTLQEIDEIIETKIRDGKVIFETQHRKKDGSVIDVEVAGSFFIHEEDTILISLVKEIS